MNEVLAELAATRIRAALGVSAAGWCQKWVRQVVEALYGRRFARLYTLPDGTRLDAKQTALRAVALARAGKLPAGVEVIEQPTVEQTRLGDLLYKTTGRNGHVGIRVVGNRVAENSSTRVGRVFRALGFRTFAQYGPVNVAVRLAPPARKAA